MKSQLIYDLPTRIFHWLFAGIFLTAFSIANTIDSDSPIFSYHMLAGLILSFLVLLRIFWGIVGTKHARFSGFALKPGDLISYFKGILSGDKKRWAGHNPASSWAALMMMGMALGLGGTGYLMASGPNKEIFEDIHELLANSFIVVVILHVAGIVLHTLRYREMIVLSMVSGKKSGVSSEEGIESSKSGVGTLFIGLLVVFSTYLFKNYDNQARTLQFFGTTLQLGENEGQELGENEAQEHEAREHGESDED
ncbi:MAG: cytochrome b/b6 domain-containing protein [Pseudobdellovibrionaceae bacterium]